MVTVNIEEGNKPPYKQEIHPTIASTYHLMCQILHHELVLKIKGNLRPWSDFINTSNFRSPTNLPRTMKRVFKNVEYFQSNYLFISFVLMAYYLVTTPMLFVVASINIILCCTASLKSSEKRFKFGNVELTPSLQYAIITLICLPFYFMAGVGGAIFWVLGASFFVIMVHASFFNIIDKEAIFLNPEETMEQV